jgi:hypothetical protein
VNSNRAGSDTRHTGSADSQHCADGETATNVKTAGSSCGNSPSEKESTMEFEMTNTQAQANPAAVVTAPALPSLASRMALTAGLTLFAYATLSVTLGLANAIDRSTWFGKVKDKFKKKPMKVSPEAAVAVDNELSSLRMKIAEKDQLILAQQNELAENVKDYSALEEELAQAKAAKN